MDNPCNIWRLLKAHCPIAAKISVLKSKRITPDIAEKYVGYDGDGLAMTIGEAYCAREMNDEVRNYIEK